MRTALAPPWPSHNQAKRTGSLSPPWTPLAAFTSMCNINIRKTGSERPTTINKQDTVLSLDDSNGSIHIYVQHHHRTGGQQAMYLPWYQSRFEDSKLPFAISTTDSGPWHACHTLPGPFMASTHKTLAERQNSNLQKNKTTYWDWKIIEHLQLKWNWSLVIQKDGKKLKGNKVAKRTTSPLKRQPSACWAC